MKMDPYVVTRIGDVTIERVLPKQDQIKKDNVTNQAEQSSQQTDLDTFFKRNTSINRPDDEGGGSNDVLSDSEGTEDEGLDDGEHESEESDEGDDCSNIEVTLLSNRAQDSVNMNLQPSHPSMEESKTLEEEAAENICSQSDKVITDETVDVESEKVSVDREEEGENITVDEHLEQTENLEVEEENSRELEESDKEFLSEDKIPEIEASEIPEDLKIKLERDSGDEDDMIVIKQEPLEKEITADNDDSTAKRKMSESEEQDRDLEKKTKKTKTDKEESSDSDSESNTQSGIDKSVLERKVSNLRRNIREVMDETQLDEATLAAQRQEMERLRRVQEQQRLMREVLVNKQITINRQNSKAQTRVVSLLQGNSSVLKSSTSTSAMSKPTSPNTVLVKLSSGTGAPQVVNKKVLEILRSTKSSTQNTNTMKTPNLSRTFLNKPHMMTPSVSIAPVKPSTPVNKVTEEDKTGITPKSGTKPKGKDVVTISSSSSDEDDCILISEPSGGEESDQEEDTSNSGMHTNDLYNIPDEQGRVLVNVGRPENEPDVFLAPQIARIIKPHQIGGIRFLFDNVVESLERFKTSTGFGCILAHSMGLGKTLQVVSFCDVFLRYTEARTVLCIMPINTLQNWLAEFNMWLPADVSASHLAAHGEVRPRTFPIFVLNDLQKSIVARAKVIAQWSKEGGVLLIGYELYRQLSLQRPRRSRKTKKKLNPDDDVDDDKNKPLLEEMHSALVKPGPDLVICDEGHRIKNSHASISQALKQIRSKRRVVLTGYPLQNNLLEYWCMVDFVRPNYLGTKTEFSNMFERPIQNGQCIDSTPQDIRLMRYRAHVLHSLLEGFVQRRSHSVLQNSLPQKEEYVLLVRMTKFQRKLYDTFMNEVVRTKAVPNPLKAFAVCCKIWNHPDVLYEFLKKRGGGEAVDLDLEETAGSLTPSTPNSSIPSAPSTPGTPAKRGRGRSPKANTSPTKRERKTNTRRKGQPALQPATKSPAVAAVIPNTTSSILQSSETPSSQTQTDNNNQIAQPEKPLQNTSFQQPAQFGSNYNNFPAGNNSYPPYPSNQPYQNYNHQQQGEYSGQYPGYQNPPNYNNPNFYQGYSGYYPSTQDPGFNGGNYWNNSYFNNDSNNHNFFQTFAQSGSNSNNGSSNSSTGNNNNSNNNFFNQGGFNSEGFNPGFNNNPGANQQACQGMDVNNQGNINSNVQGSTGMNQSQIICNNSNNQNQSVSGVNCQNQVRPGMNGQINGSMGINIQNQGGTAINSQNQGIVDITSQSQSTVGLNIHSQGGSVANIQSQIGGGINPQSQGSSTGNVQNSQNQNVGNQVGIGIASQNQCGTGMLTQNQSPGSQQAASGTGNDKPQNDSTTSAGQCGMQSMLCNTSNQNFAANQQNPQPPINSTVNSQALLSQQNQHNVLNSSQQPSQNIIRQDVSQNSLSNQHIVNNLGVQNQLLNQLNSQNAGINHQNSQSIINSQQLSTNTLTNQQNFHNTLGIHQNSQNMVSKQPYPQNIITGQQTIQLNNQSNSQLSLGNTNILGSQQNLSNTVLNSQNTQQNSHILMSQQNPQNVMLNQQNPQNALQVQQNSQNVLNNSSETQNVLGNQQNIQVFSDSQCPQNIMNTQQTMINAQQNNQNLPGTQQSSSNILNNSQNQQNIAGSSHNTSNNPQLFGSQNSHNTYSNLQLPQNILNSVQNPPSVTGNASNMIDSSQNSSNILADSQNHGNLLSSSNISDNVISNMCGNIQQNSQTVENSQNPQNMQGNLNPHLLPVNTMNCQGTSVGPQNFVPNSQNPPNVITNTHNVYNPNIFTNEQNSQMHSQQGMFPNQNIQNVAGNVQNQQNMVTNVQNPQNMFRGMHGQQNPQHPQNVFSGPHNQTNNMGNHQNQFSNHQNINVLNGQQISPNISNTSQNSNMMGSQQNLPNFVGAGQANIHGNGGVQQNSQNIRDNQYNSNNVPLNQQVMLAAHPNNSGSSNNNNNNNSMSGDQQNVSNMRLVQSGTTSGVNGQNILGNSHSVSAIVNNQHIPHNQQNSQNLTNFQNMSSHASLQQINPQSTAPGQHTQHNVGGSQQNSQSPLPLPNQSVAFNQNMLVSQPGITSNQSNMLQNQQGSMPNQQHTHGNISHQGMMLPQVVVDNQQNSVMQSQQTINDSQSVMSNQQVPRHNQTRVNTGATNMINPLERQQNVFSMNSNQQGFVNNQTLQGQPQQGMAQIVPGNNSHPNLSGNQQNIGTGFNNMNSQNTILNQQEMRVANTNIVTNQATSTFGGGQLNNMMNTFNQQGRMTYQSNIMNNQQGSYGVPDHLNNPENHQANTFSQSQQTNTFSQPNNPGNQQAIAFSQAQQTNTFNQPQSNTFSQSQQTNLFNQNQQQNTFSHNQQANTFSQNQQTNTFNQNQQVSSQSNPGPTQNVGFAESRSNSGTDHPEMNQNGVSVGGNQGADMYGNSMDSDNIQNYRGSQIGGGFPTGFPQSSESLGQGTNLERGATDNLQLTSVGTNTNSFTSDFGNFRANNEDSKTFEKWNDSTGKTDVTSDKLEQTSNLAEIKDDNVKSEFTSTQKNTLKVEDVKSGKCEMKDGSTGMDDDKQVMKSPKPDEELEEGEIKPDITVTSSTIRGGREDPGIPYDWATELMKGYAPGDIEASAKMALLFCILEESMALGDRVLVFSQSLFTLNLVEDFLQKRNVPGKAEKWAKNWTYYRLDGSTSALEREKLINEFNSNPNIHLFLVSTRAGSLGINLVGANRVLVLDASWNPCHDTQAVCRVYRYGQKKPCFVYRLVMDNCLEKKIYDRQINKQGMADRVVDECNPDAHLSIKEVTNLCWDNEEDTDAKDFSHMKDKYIDVVMQKVLEKYSHLLSKEPFQHESLLVDRKDKKLSQAEKRLAKRSYELEKQASINNARPLYGYYPGAATGNQQFRGMRGDGANQMVKPMASVRPMQSELNSQLIRDVTSSRPRQWIPAEVWQKQGMSAQEMTLPLDVVIPTNSPDRSSIVLKAGQKVMVLKSPKGIYMQLENGKIIAIRTAFKVGGNKATVEKKSIDKRDTSTDPAVKKVVVQPTRQRVPNNLLPLRNNSNISIIPRNSPAPRGVTPTQKPLVRMLGPNRDKNWSGHKQPVATARPYFGEGPTQPPVTVTVTKKRVGTQQSTVSAVQTETHVEKSKNLTQTISTSQEQETLTQDSKKSQEINNISKGMPSDGQAKSIESEMESHIDEQTKVDDFRMEQTEAPKDVETSKGKMSSISKDEDDYNNVGEEEDEQDYSEDEEVDDDYRGELQNNETEHSEVSSTSNPIPVQQEKSVLSMHSVPTLKNYQHLGLQNKKPLLPGRQAVTINPITSPPQTQQNSSIPVFNSKRSMSVSPVCSSSAITVNQANTVAVNASSATTSTNPCNIGGLSTSVTSINSVPTHSSQILSNKPSKLPSSSVSIQPVALQPNQSDTSVSQMPSAFSIPTSSPSLTSATLIDSEKKIPDLSKELPSVSASKGDDISTPSQFPTALSHLKSRADNSISIFPVESKSNQPSSTVNSNSQISSFTPSVDFNYRPDYQQHVPPGRVDYFPGLNRGQLGYPSGFYGARKDSSGKDIGTGLPQYSPFDSTTYLQPNPFSAAAAAAGSAYTSTSRPHNSSFPAQSGGIQPTVPQPTYESDFNRMYSAFHRPDPHSASTSTSSSPSSSSSSCTPFPTQSQPIPPPPSTQYNPYTPYSSFLMHPPYHAPPPGNPNSQNPSQ